MSTPRRPIRHSRPHGRPRQWSLFAALAAVSLLLSAPGAALAAGGDTESPVSTEGVASAQSGDETPAASPQSMPEDASTPTDTSADGGVTDPEAVEDPGTEVETDPAPSQPTPTEGATAAKAQARAGISLLGATPTTTDIVLTKRTVAQPLGTSGSVGNDTAYTNGAVFRLHSYTTVAAGPVAALGDPWASCTMSAGSCTITVPDTGSGGANAGKQFWVVEENAAGGTYANTVLKVGNYQGPTTTRYYPGLTPAMRGGETINMPKDALSTNGTGAGSSSATNQEKSFGAVADSLNNPTITPTCSSGVTIALQLDMSPSIDAAELAQYRAAITGTGGLLDSLKGTNSSVALFTFNSTSPGQNTPSGWNYPQLLNVDQGNNLATLKSRVNGLNNTGGATNWDRAFRAVGTADQNYDVLLFVTDGAPNYITGTGGANTTAQPDSYNVAVRSLEAAIYSANAVKAEGTRVVAVGVGGGVTAAGENLRAVSGPTASSDYFQTSNWSALSSQLAEIAQGLTCQVPVTVHKQVTDPEGNNAQAASEWSMNVALASGTTGATLTAPAATTTDATGATGEWVVKFDAPDGTAGIDVSETVKDGYAFASATYTITHSDTTTTTGTFDAVTGTVPGVVVGDRVDVTFTNRTIPPTGTFDLTKLVSNPDGVTGLPESYTIRYQIAGGTTQIATLTQGTPGPQITADAGATVTLWEDPPTDVAGAKWGTPSWSVGDSALTPDPTTGKVTVTIKAGTNVAVTVTNPIAKKPATFTIKKALTGAGAPLVPDATTFDIDYYVNGSTTPSGTLTVKGDGTPTQGPTLTHGDTVRFQEHTPPLTPGVIWGDAVISPATLTLDAERTTPVVTVTNPSTPVRLTLDKSDGVVTQRADMTWQVDYTLTVTNPTSVDTTFTLTDIPDPGTGFKVASQGWQGDAPAPGTAIAAGANRTFTYRVVYSFNPNVSDPQLTCDPDTGGAFFNGATLAFPGGSATDTGCGEPASHTVTKTALTPVQSGIDDNWTVAYRVTVANTSDITLAYDLSDDVADLPTGVTSVGSWHVSGPVKSPEGAGEVSLAPSWAGSGKIGTGTLPAAATHTYTVTGVVHLADTVEAGDLECSSPGGGIINRAVVTNGVGTDADDACTSLEIADLDLTKTVTSTVQQADGTWAVGYSVVVRNLSSTVASRYSLVDTLDLGKGITARAASWTGGGDSGTFDLSAGTATLAAGRILPAGATHTYTVALTAAVDPSAWTDGDAQLVCGAGDEGGGGFLNAATLTHPGGTDTDEDCSQPSLPRITKDFVSATQSPTNATRWSIVYTVTVTGAEHDTVYDLADVPGFAQGVDVVSGSARRTDTSPAGEPVALVSGGGTIATGVALDVRAVHTWEVVWTVGIPAAPAPEVAVCGETPSAGHGLYNRATLTVGGVEIDDDACGPVEDIVVPGVDKAVTSVTQDPADGAWDIVYTVTVTLPTDEVANPSGLSAAYDLDDTLDFGAGLRILSAQWTGPGGTSGDIDPGSGRVLLAEDRTITTADPVHVYTVSVRADVGPQAVEEQTLTCASGEESAGGGFLNTVELRSGGTTQVDEACAEPVVPTVSKTGLAPEALGDGTWRVSWVVTVANPAAGDGAPAVIYRLTDTPADLPEGVSLAEGTTWEVSARDAATPDPVAGERPAQGDWVIAEGSLRAGESHSYVVAATVVVDADATFETGQCADVGGNGIVLPNLVDLTSGAYNASDEGCTTVQPPMRWTLVKSSEPPSGSTVGAGSRIRYTLTVTNRGQVPVVGAGVVDDLSGVLAHAALDLPLADGLTRAGHTLVWAVPDVAVGASVSVSYTVTVDADVADIMVRNVAAPTTPGGTCEEGRCSTEHKVPPVPVPTPTPTRPVPTPAKPASGLVKTGSDASVVGLLALLAAVSGVLMTGRRRSRRLE